MKIRNGFVSNSSSSSFILDKSKLSVKNLSDIKNAYKLAVEFDIEYPEDIGGWTLYENDDELHGCTIIDNFQFLGFLDRIGVPREAFKERLSENGAGKYDYSDEEIKQLGLKVFNVDRES